MGWGMSLSHYRLLELKRRTTLTGSLWRNTRLVFCINKVAFSISMVKCSVLILSDNIVIVKLMKHYVYTLNHCIHTENLLN